MSTEAFEMSEETFEMVQDAMVVIENMELQDYIRKFYNNLGFAYSDHPNVMNIYSNLKYKGHSGSSFALTMRFCQYFLDNMGEWHTICEKFNLPKPPGRGERSEPN